MERLGGGERQIEHAAFCEWAAVIDDDHYAALRAGIRNPQACAEWQVAMGRSKFIWIVMLAARGSPAVVYAVVRRDPGKLAYPLCKSVGRWKTGK